MIEWYGDDQNGYMDNNKKSKSQIARSYQNRVDAIIKKLMEKKEKDIFSLEVKEVIGEYGFVMKQCYQMKNEKAMMLELAASYKSDEKLRKVLDEDYGEGTAEFIADAIRAFYTESK